MDYFLWLAFLAQGKMLSTNGRPCQVNTWGQVLNREFMRDLTPLFQSSMYWSVQGPETAKTQTGGQTGVKPLFA